MTVYGLLLGLQAFPFDDVRYDCIRISGHNMTQAMRAVFVGQSHRRYIGVSTFSNGSDPAAKWDHRCGLARILRRAELPISSASPIVFV